MRSPRVAASSIALILVLLAAPVGAQETSSFSSPGATGTFSSPRPTGFLPSSLFDPSRFSISHSATFGYTAGSGYGGSSGLWTSSLGYRIRSNTMLRVDVGAHMNPAFGGEGGTQKGIFLQGATLDWKPTSNSLVRFEYRDVRSPLQYGYGGYGYGSPYGYGYGSPSSLGGLGGPDDVPVGSGLPGDPMRN
jgi:hypothetical protein